MIEKKMLKYVLYGTSVIICSEIAYRILRKWLKRMSDVDSSRNDDEVAIVIYTNELTTSCTNVHESTKSRINGQNTSQILCKNVYCAINNIGRLVELIDSTKYTIDLAMYIFTSFELSNAICRALKRGVDVRVISDKGSVYSSGSQLIDLTKSGIPVRCPSITTTFMHHKFCILDGPNRAVTVLSRKQKTYETKHVKGIIISGSLNWTCQGFGGNWENVIISSNKELVKSFEKEFERMWISFKDKLPASTYNYKNNIIQNLSNNQD